MNSEKRFGVRKVGGWWVVTDYWMPQFRGATFGDAVSFLWWYAPASFRKTMP